MNRRKQTIQMLLNLIKMVENKTLAHVINKKGGVAHAEMIHHSIRRSKKPVANIRM